MPPPRQPPLPLPLAMPLVTSDYMMYRRMWVGLDIEVVVRTCLAIRLIEFNIKSNEYLLSDGHDWGR